MEGPQPGTDEIVTTLESVLALNPDHPGACHYYIHALRSIVVPGTGARPVQNDCQT